MSCTIADLNSISLWDVHRLVFRELHEYQHTRILTSYSRGGRVFAGANICFWILVANASIDFPERQIFEYFLGAIRLIYTWFGSYIELCTSNLSSLGCILSYTGPLLMYITPLRSNLVYLRPRETVEAQILDWYSRISNTRIFVGYSRVLHNHTRTNANIDIGTCRNILYLWVYTRWRSEALLS